MAGGLKVAVLISGRGSNLQALLDACAQPGFPAKIVRVISNVATATGLERAHQAGVATEVINHKAYPSREAFDAALDAAIRASGAELVCLAGFMRLLTPGFTESWRDRMINIHPSLLPSFKGLHTHQRAIEAGVKLHGCTVHFVTPDLDDGPIIAQAAVPVQDGDNEDSLSARVLTAEHRIYPLALKLIGEGRVSVDGRIVRVSDPAPAQAALINPAD
ncbi:MAG TPA: phosphoribosylglycinamide formyltransferase [Patescibacteria group bacterium]|nr:phosphoribosylglycinamide formyltransferase [Patescibacteria group bacterium]